MQQESGCLKETAPLHGPVDPKIYRVFFILSLKKKWQKHGGTPYLLPKVRSVSISLTALNL